MIQRMFAYRDEERVVISFTEPSGVVGLELAALTPEELTFHTQHIPEGFVLVSSGFPGGHSA